MKCLQCGSDDIVKNVRIVDRGDHNTRHNLSLEVYAKPSAWIFKEAKQGILKANVCADCGFVMMSVSKSEAIMLKKAKKTRRTQTGKRKIT